MPTWIVLTAAASIVITGALTWVLWRLNQGAEGDAPRRENASGSAIVASDTSTGKPKVAHEDNDASDSGSDGGGGGDGGGGD